jgi:ABC-type Zn uptake system ZnuABC Zn-binding protein ZnuA
MQKRPVFLAMLFLGMALCFIGCAIKAESTEDAYHTTVAATIFALCRFCKNHYI